jgi:hypothetical protein
MSNIISTQNDHSATAKIQYGSQTPGQRTRQLFDLEKKYRSCEFSAEKGKDQIASLRVTLPITLSSLFPSTFLPTSGTHPRAQKRSCSSSQQVILADHHIVTTRETLTRR